VLLSAVLLSAVLLSAVLLNAVLQRRRFYWALGAVDRYLLPAGPTAANPPRLQRKMGLTDRQMDGQTDIVSLQRPCHILLSIRHDCMNSKIAKKTEIECCI